ncbi:unnamed protein product [Cochlearia groenlandica]
MSEEYDESEIIFSDGYFPIRHREIEKENRPIPIKLRENSVVTRNNNKSKKTKTTPSLPSHSVLSTSLPVNIPGDMMRRRYATETAEEEEKEYSVDVGGIKMIPPHIIVRRRMDGEQMAFSVCIGNGRTLKGRDLSRVRNSVLKLTGFLES